MIGDSVLEEAEQPSMGDGIEKASDVCIEHPVHSSFYQADVQGIHSIMRATPRPESIGKAEEVRLVDGDEDRQHRLLDDLLFQGSNAQGTHPSVRFGDIGPPGGRAR
jgi:hypothetical protein